MTSGESSANIEALQHAYSVVEQRYNGGNAISTVEDVVKAAVSQAVIDLRMKMAETIVLAPLGLSETVVND
jgi:hypothetical protein